jgi:hypothetical protein
MNRADMNRAKTSRFRGALRLFLTTLREIFDEAAYERFLRRSQRMSSTEAYAAFREEFEAAKTRRPKCC